MAISHKITSNEGHELHEPMPHTRARIGTILGMILLAILIIAGIWWAASRGTEPAPNLHTTAPAATSSNGNGSGSNRMMQMQATTSTTTTIPQMPSMRMPADMEAMMGQAKMFVAQEGGFTLRYPASWTARTQQDGQFMINAGSNDPLPALRYIPDIRAVALGTYEQERTEKYTSQNGNAFTLAHYRPKPGATSDSGTQTNPNDRIVLIGAPELFKGALFYGYNQQDDPQAITLLRTILDTLEKR